MDDLHIFRPEYPEYFADHPDHLWEAGKLGLDLDDVFTTLPKRFNLMPIPILDRESFRIETQRASSLARNRVEFYKLLRSRLEARRTEQVKMMIYALSRLSGDPAQLPVENWGHAMHIYRSKSFDAIVRFLAGFLRPDDDEDVYLARMGNLAPGWREDSEPRSNRASPSPNTINPPSGAPAETSSRPPSSVPTAPNSQELSTTSDSTGRRTRKRSLTPETMSPAEDDCEEEMQPSKRLRFDNDMVELRAAPAPTATRRPIMPQARRVRKGQSSVPQSDRSTMTSATIVPSNFSESQPAADEASGVYPFEAPDSVSTSHQTSQGNRGLRRVVPAVTETRTRKGSRRPQPRKGKTRPRQPPLFSPFTELSKTQNSTSRPAPKAKRPTTAQGSRSRDAEQQPRSSQRLTRQTRQGGQALYELDSHGKAFLVTT